MEDLNIWLRRFSESQEKTGVYKQSNKDKNLPHDVEAVKVAVTMQQDHYIIDTSIVSQAKLMDATCVGSTPSEASKLLMAKHPEKLFKFGAATGS